MEMPGRIKMRAVMGGERDLLHRPALAVRQVFRLQPLEELQHARQALLVVDILDGRMIAGRIGRHVILQWHGNVDQRSRHCALLRLRVWTQAWTPTSLAAVRPRISAFWSSESPSVAKIGSTGCISHS